MSKQDNLATQEKAGELFSQGDYDGAVDMLFADDTLDHDPAPGQGPGREGYREFFRGLYAAFPDASLEPVAVVADDDHISMAYTLTGTHRGAFHGVEPTGRRIEVRGIQLGRFEDGRIVERWGSTDELGILTQLQAEPA